MKFASFYKNEAIWNKLVVDRIVNWDSSKPLMHASSIKKREQGDRAM